MKTIAVLTDFSERSVHAARYALQLAQKIKADILLFHSFLVPDLSSRSAHSRWPDVDYEQVKNDCELELLTTSLKLKKELKDKNLSGLYSPSINFRCEEGAIANSIAELEENKNIILLVLGAHGEDKETEFMMGNNCRQIIDAASIPLLIVPEHASLKNIEKFMFATDNSIGDIDYINALSSLAKYFSAEIAVANVNSSEHANTPHDSSTNLFWKEIVDKVLYNRVYYRSIPNANVKNGIDWLIENVKFDILVMVHRKSMNYDFYFKPSITKKIADRVYVPLMVFPNPVDSIPNF